MTMRRWLAIIAGVQALAAGLPAVAGAPAWVTTTSGLLAAVLTAGTAAYQRGPAAQTLPDGRSG